MKRSHKEPLLQSIKPCPATDVLKLWARENRFQFASVAGKVGGRLLEAIEVGAQAFQPNADGSGVGSVLFLVIPSNIPLHTLGGNVEFPLIGADVPALRQITQRLGR